MKYLVKASYTAEGAKGVLAKGGSARRDSVSKAVADLGGSVEAFYFAFGDHDAFVIVDMPDVAAVASLALQVGAAGGASVSTVVLLTPEEVDDAAQRTKSYVPPGG